jgi:uncharacterized protein YecT (DUF1311 family)
MRRALVPALVLTALAAALPARAQQVDCSAAQTQMDLTFCAQQAWMAADEDLNLAWGLAMAAARAQDAAYLPPGAPPAADMLRAAQRTWITFRDQACAAESNLARGGSMQPMLDFSCRERLTRQRTEDLRYYGEMN